MNYMLVDLSLQNKQTNWFEKNKLSRNKKLDQKCKHPVKKNDPVIQLEFLPVETLLEYGWLTCHKTDEKDFELGSNPRKKKMEPSFLKTVIFPPS